MQEFEQKLKHFQNSEAYLTYCETLTGVRMPLFNMLDTEQIEFILHQLPCTNADNILDIGCGSGSILSELINLHECRGCGIDCLSEKLVALPEGKAYYIKADLDTYPYEQQNSTITLLIDSIYFSHDPKQLLQTLCKIPNNRIYLFYSQYLMGEDALDSTRLLPDGTQVAEILKQLGISYQVRDYRINERLYYDHSITELQRLREAFCKEGLDKAWEEKLKEQMLGQQLYEEGRASRYLYII